jgi:hypothetical protein
MVQGSTAVLSMISILALCYLIFWLFRRTGVARFRQEMFFLRDGLFDEARDGLIDFNHPAYGYLRMTMNGFIRFGHRLTLWQLLFTWLLIGKPDTTRLLGTKSSWAYVSRDLNGPVLKRLNEYRSRMAFIVVKHLLLSFPEGILLWPFVAVGLVWFIILIVRYGAAENIPQSARDRIGDNFEGLATSAYVYGSC